MLEETNNIIEGLKSEKQALELIIVEMLREKINLKINITDLEKNVNKLSEQIDIKNLQIEDFKKKINEISSQHYSLDTVECAA
jgi:cell division protein FtsL